MLPTEFELFVKYAIGLALVVMLIALWRVRKRGPTGFFLVGGAGAFALFLTLLLFKAADVWLYAAAFVVLACLVADATTRTKKDKP